ncbi:MAG: hypothetical protein IJY46_05380 [Lentisphaeria bacterium]|nr:hypothetical protein [Lentisphaeria bacterium]
MALHDRNKELAAIAKFNSGRVAVLGDIMLDAYLWGAVNRISPEAPVPVVDVRRRSCCPGGAANVIRNIATLGGHAKAFGIVGNDPAGKEVIALLKEYGADIAGIIRSNERRTTEKCRVVAGAQQLLRADFEDTTPISEADRDKLVSKVVRHIRKAEIDAVIFDDYAKGVLCADMLKVIIKEAKRSNIFTMLDPKPKSGGVTPVAGLTLLKPNRSEAFALAGINDPGPVNDPAEDQPLRRAAEKIFEIWQPENLLISLAGQGMILYPANGEPQVIPTRAREVFDVSGAGDTVAAVCTLALATGCSPLLAAELANRAAGVVVGKIGTAPILFDELLAAIKE